MTTTAPLTDRVNCRCEVAGCGLPLAEHEVLAHLVLAHGFGMEDWPVRANVETDTGEPL